MEDERLCRRCLLRDMPESSYLETMKNYIEGLDEEVKADKEEYEKRLLACRNCDRLMNGMCRLCGCFVEMRAVIAANYCPDGRGKW